MHHFHLAGTHHPAESFKQKMESEEKPKSIAEVEWKRWNLKEVEVRRRKNQVIGWVGRQNDVMVLNVFG